LKSALIAATPPRTVDSRPAGRPTPIVDMSRALELLATAVQQRGGCCAALPLLQPCACATGGEPRCLVCHALSLAQVHDDDLEAMRGRTIRELYATDRLPVPLTFGAIVVLDTAQRSEDRGATWTDALKDAAAVAIRYLDLIPDRALHT
jgi:hypothetical protein